MPLQCCMTLGKSLHLSALPFIIYKTGVNVAPASRVVGRTENHAAKALSLYPHIVRARDGSYQDIIEELLKFDGRKKQLMKYLSHNRITAHTKLNEVLGGHRKRSS